jgi:hypothetical protein
MPATLSKHQPPTVEEELEDEIAEFMSQSLLGGPYASRSKKAPQNRPVTPRMQQIMAKERKDAAIRCFREVCEKTYAGAGAYTASNWGAGTREKRIERLLGYIEKIEYWDSCQKIFGHIAEHGTITQVSQMHVRAHSRVLIFVSTAPLWQDLVYEYGGKHPFDSESKADPLSSKCGVYCHMTTKRHKKTGELVTSIYVGSAQGGVRSLDEFFGFARRICDYRIHDGKWKAKKFDQAYHNAHDSLSAHADHWPYDDDEFVVINTAWWVAMAQTRLEHFTALCQGDEDTARYLMSVFLQDKNKMPVSFTDMGCYQRQR